MVPPLEHTQPSEAEHPATSDTVHEASVLRGRSRLEDFWPRDNIPWEALSAGALELRTASGFFGLRAAWLIDSEVRWLCANLGLAPGAHVLDLGCGPGQYSHGLAASGMSVTGIDIAEPLLEYARQRAIEQRLDCRYERLSMFELSFQQAFQAVLLVNSVINQTSEDELRGLFERVSAALASGGHFVCEVALAPDDYCSRGERSVEKETVWDRSPWCDRPHTWLQRTLTFPRQAERVTHHIISEPNRSPREYWSRYNLFRRDRLQELLQSAGFARAHWFGPTLGQASSPSDALGWFWARKGP